MAINLNKLPDTWEQLTESKQTKSMCPTKELGPIFKLLHLADVSTQDVDLLLDQEGNKMLRVNIFKRTADGSENYERLMYGPLTFREGKVFSFASVIHEFSVDGRKLINPYRDTVTLPTERLASKIKDDVEKILDSRRRSLPF